MSTVLKVFMFLHVTESAVSGSVQKEKNNKKTCCQQYATAPQQEMEVFETEMHEVEQEDGIKPFQALKLSSTKPDSADTQA